LSYAVHKQTDKKLERTSIDGTSLTKVL